MKNAVAFRLADPVQWWYHMLHMLHQCIPENN